MDKNLEKEIREFEKAGIDVVATKNGKLEHVTGGINQSPNVCDSCPNLIFAPDPDPYDFFRDGDQKALCLSMKAAIETGLERPSEMVNILKPIWCPCLGRELTSEEKKHYDSILRIAKSDY